MPHRWIRGNRLRAMALGACLTFTAFPMQSPAARADGTDAAGAPTCLSRPIPRDGIALSLRIASAWKHEGKVSLYKSATRQKKRANRAVTSVRHPSSGR